MVSHAIIIGAGPPGGNISTTQKIFTETASKADYVLEDEYVLSFEPQSQSSRKAAELSYRRMSKRTEDLDILVSREYWNNE